MSYRASISSSIRELRFVMCQQSQASLGARAFVRNNYQGIKQANPGFPFIVRECANAQPTVMARYDFGIERRLYLNDLTEAEVNAAVEELVTQANSVRAAS